MALVCGPSCGWYVNGSWSAGGKLWWPRRGFCPQGGGAAETPSPRGHLHGRWPFWCAPLVWLVLGAPKWPVMRSGLPGAGRGAGRGSPAVFFLAAKLLGQPLDNTTPSLFAKFQAHQGSPPPPRAATRWFRDMARPACTRYKFLSPIGIPARACRGDTNRRKQACQATRSPVGSTQGSPP